MLNLWLTRRKRKLRAGELSELTFGRYTYLAEVCRDFLGATTSSRLLTAADFERLRESMAKRLGPVSLNADIGIIRSMFQLGQRKGLVPRKIDFGECFPRPPARTLRTHRNARKPQRQFTPEEIRALLAKAPPATKVMILLGIQAGFGNTECTLLPLNCLEREPGWLNFARTKTAVMRRIPLWPETIEAIRAAIAARPEAKRQEDAGLLLLSRRGNSLVSNRRGDAVGYAFNAVMKKCGLSGRSFYDLRRNFKIFGHAERISEKNFPAITSFARSGCVFGHVELSSNYVRTMLTMLKSTLDY